MSSNPAPRPSGSKQTGAQQKALGARQIPESMVKRKPEKISPIIVVGIVVCFIIAAASAIAPLVFRVSHWWLALSMIMLGIAVSAVMALRQP
jgi:hypothetical protein